MSDNPFIGSGKLIKAQEGKGDFVSIMINLDRLIELGKKHSFDGPNGRRIKLDMFMKKKTDSKGNHYNIVVDELNHG